MPAEASDISNIGRTHISHRVFRGCGSSVNSTAIDQPWSTAYWICAAISSSVRSGKYENVPWVIRMLRSSGRRGGHDVRRVGGLVVEGDVAPGIQGRLQRLEALGRLG